MTRRSKVIVVGLVALAGVVGLVAKERAQVSAPSIAESARDPGRRGRADRAGRRSHDDDPGSESRGPRLRAEGRGMRAMRHVEIVSLGPTPPALDRAMLERAIDSTRPSVRACIAANGGRSALVDAMRSETGAIERHRIVVDFAPDGTVVPTSVAIEPGLSPVLTECFSAALLPLALGPLGPDGARVSFPLRGMFGPGQGARSDGGVPR